MAHAWQGHNNSEANCFMGVGIAQDELDRVNRKITTGSEVIDKNSRDVDRLRVRPTRLSSPPVRAMLCWLMCFTHSI